MLNKIYPFTWDKSIRSGLQVQKHAAFAPTRQKLLGFRLRSPLPSVEEPCPLSLQTVFFTCRPSQNNNVVLRFCENIFFQYAGFCLKFNHGFFTSTFVFDIIKT